MIKERHLFFASTVLLLAWLAIGAGVTETEGRKKPQTVPATEPDPKVVVGKMSINGVELQYSGPVEIPDGMAAIVGLSVLNTQEREIYFIMSRIEERLSFWVSVKSPKGKVSHFQTFGVGCDRETDGVLSLGSGKKLEEHLDLAQYLTDGPGDYQITITLGYNGVIRFPGYDLRLDVPLSVISEKADKGKKE